MVIDYNTYPSLRVMVKGNPDWLIVPKAYDDYDNERSEQLCKRIIFVFKETIRNGSIQDSINGNVKIYSKTFCDAARKAFLVGENGKQLLLNVLKEHYNGEIYKNGLYVFDDFSVIITIDKEYPDIAAFTVIMRNSLLMCCAIKLDTDAVTEIFIAEPLARIVKATRSNDGTMPSTPVITEFLAMMMFEKHAKVDVETCPMKHTIQSASLKEKIKNRYGFGVQMMDARWYKEICKDEDFAVRGHFRMQPFGKRDEKNREKRLIFIEPFLKHGYHRKAAINTERKDE